MTVGENPNTGARRLEDAIAGARGAGQPALAAFLTGGFPSLDAFEPLARDIAAVVDIVEIGVPFSDPMADGATIQQASHDALRAGASLRWIVDRVRVLATTPNAPPFVLMSYVNPLLAYGIADLARDARDAGVSGMIVPDLPLEESEPIRDILDASDIALIQLVSPVTPHRRLQSLARASRGFVYAVTMRGTTGGAVGDDREVVTYLDRLKSVSRVPVLAGFGIRTPEQVRQLASHADGVIVGSALIEAIRDGRDPVALLRALRTTPAIGSEQER